MIDRYARPEMKEIFSLGHKFDTYLKIELAVSKVLAEHKVIPQEDYEKIAKNAKVNLQEVLELEKETKHDVIAFTRSVSNSLGEERKWVHYLLTSTDVVDSSLAYIYKEADEILYQDLLKLRATLKNLALKYKFTPQIGRTHGIHADITSFGLKWALYYDELNRDIRRFLEAKKDLETIKISGAVGNFANIPPYVQDEVAESLNLNSALISTQVLSRDNHAYYFSVLTIISSLCEKIAFEIRLLQQTEIHEVDEYFSKGQKGSSAMPHKKNPISSENICGLSRLMRGYLLPILEDNALWHERDISHSSVERVALPDGITLLDYQLNRLNNVLSKLIVYEDKMKEDIYLTHGVIFSQRVMTELIDKGLSRENAYDLVQALALKSYNEHLDFHALLVGNDDIKKHLSEEEIDSCFTLDYYFKNVDFIYKKVGIE